METIPLNAASDAGPLILAGLASLGLAAAAWAFLWKRNKKLAAVQLTGLLAAFGLLFFWLGWRTPKELGVAPGAVEVRYTGLRPARRFKAADAGVTMKYHEELYGKPEYWALYLLLPEGEEVYLHDANSHEEAVAFIQKLEAALGPAAAP